MSKFVDEILKDIRENKNNWIKCDNGAGIKKDNIYICQHGNTALLSVVHILINEVDMPLTYMDKWRLEKAVGWWYKNIDLQRALA
jgi:hypothetical protein